MAELNGNLETKQADQALSPEERRIFSQIFSAVDSEGLGVVTGDVAIKFLPEKTRLPSEILGEIWQVADPDDKGFVTKAGFFVILRLIGYAQAGRSISPDLALRPGPLPRLEGPHMPGTAPLQAQGSGGPIPIPKLLPEKATQYATLFEQSGARDGVLDGITAKQIFDRAQLPNDVLIRIWNLADTEQRGKLSTTEFIIAMHLLASFRSGAMRALPNNLPAGLYEAAARRGAPARSPPGSKSEFPPVSTVQRNFTGQSATARVSSPLARQQYNASPAPTQSQNTGLGNDWAIPSQEKSIYDQQFARLDVNKAGSIGGEQAVGFFGNSKLSENDLAQIWDLADITQNGQLSQDEFAVAMHLIRQQLNGRGPLPTTLPANLIPPSLRKSAVPAQGSQIQPSAQVPQSPPRTKSAMDDLFGLDVAPVQKQVPQSTGGSAAPASPAAVTRAIFPQQTANSHFKPFVPSSSFGQSIVAPQLTGQSVSPTPQQQKQASFDDDLLGDADPEESKKFTQDTTDVANLTNQVNSLTTQTRELQTKKATAEQEYGSSSNQKREIETRLAQLRTTYEQEARDLKAIQDRLNSSKADTTKLQQDFVMAQHSFQGLQEQKQQLLLALEADQKENASLKERIAQVSRETNEIKPQIEKTRSDARQQKGLVAINKKQLSTAEAEREKARAELASATNEHQDATRELEESHKALEEDKALEASRSVSPPVAADTVRSVASPAPSTTSMNPFFQRVQSSGPQGGIESSAVASPNHSAFDSFFDDAFAPPASATVAAPVTESTATETAAPLTREAVHPASGNSTPANGTSTPREADDLPSASHQPPPPPRSRQITSSNLPLGDTTPRAPSTNSSLGVVPPASQFDDASGHNTPAKEVASSVTNSEHDTSPLQHSHLVDSAEASQSPASETLQPEPKSAVAPVPGAFPVDSPAQTPGLPPNSNLDGAREIPPNEATAESTSTNNRSAFDALFGSFGSTQPKPQGAAPVSSSAFGGTSRTQTNEFPEIQEFDHDDDTSTDDEESEHDNTFSDKFAEDSATASQTLAPTHVKAGTDRPSLNRSPSTELPTASAHASPPSYMATLEPQSSEPRDANQFAQEYAGLLPSRDPHSIPNGTDTEAPIQTTSITDVRNHESSTDAQASTNELHHAASNSAAKPVADEFDEMFGDLSEAHVADTTADDDLQAFHREGHEEFNPTFDSPAPSKAPTLENSAFNDFESSISAPNQPVAASVATPTTAIKAGPSKDEWDAMFAGFGTETSTQLNGQTNGTTTGAATTSPKDAFADAFDVPAASASTLAPQRPDITRTLSETGEHDDPIVKHLTAMGYSRGVSVEALEKFDYNLDKAANYLASKS